MQDYLFRLFLKITSARFLVTLIVTITLCITVLKCFDLIKIGMEDEKKFGLIKDIIMYMLGVFSGFVTAIITSYFNRTDREAVKKQ